MGFLCIWHVQVRVCSGKPTTIVASRKGFYPAGKRPLVSHTLVGLLQKISRVFEAVSLDSLMFLIVAGLLLSALRVDVNRTLKNYTFQLLLSFFFFNNYYA